MKNIAIIGAKGLPGVYGAGGVENGVYELIKGINEIDSNYKFTLYQRGPTSATHNDINVRIKAIKFIDSKNFAFWTFLLSSVRDLISDSIKYNVVHIHCAQNGFIIPFLRLCGYNTLFHTHGCEWKVSKWNGLMAKIFYISFLIGSLSSNKIVTVEKESHDIIIKLFPFRKHRVIIIPNGVPMISKRNSLYCGFKNSNLNPVKFGLYVGRIVPQKQLETLIESWKMIDQEFDLLIAGSTSHSEEYYKKLLILKKDNSRISFLGLLNRDQLNELYDKCTLLIHPSENEGSSNTLLEALAHGCCIISSDIKENKDLLGHAGIYFTTGDSLDLYRKVTSLLKNVQQIQNQKQKSLIRAKELPSWKNVAEKFKIEYDDLQS